MENIYFPSIRDPSDLEFLITGHQLHANTNTNTNTNTNDLEDCSTDSVLDALVAMCDSDNGDSHQLHANTNTNTNTSPDTNSSTSTTTSTSTSTITNMNRSASASVSTSTSTFRAGSNNNNNNNSSNSNNSNNNNNSNNSSSSYSEINKNDVLCGRGGLTNAHVGNHRFRCTLAEYHQEYLHAPKNNKKAIAQKIVDRIEKLGGRFIHQNTGDTVWTRVTPQRALEKTSQALREGLDVKHRKVKKPVISARAGGGENRNKRKHKLVEGTVYESANAVSAATSTAVAVAVADNTHSGGRGNEARATARARATLGRNKKQHKVVVTGTAGVSLSPKSPKAVSVATSVADNDDISLDQCMAVFEVEVAFFNLIHRTTETVQQHGDTGSTSTGTGTGTSTGATTTRLIGTEIESCENVHEI